MYIFSVFALTWIPFYYIHKWYSEVNITSIIGYKEDEVYNMEDMEEREEYDTILVEYEKNGVNYKYVAEEEMMKWPIRRNLFKVSWIKEAKLRTDEIKMDIDVTDVIREYGGINEDFHETPFDFRWILIEYPEYDFYENCILEILTKNDEKIIIHIRDNEEETKVLEHYKIKLIEVKKID